jgi:site-specific DNA-methyltransferase (adenine-specific)
MNNINEQQLLESNVQDVVIGDCKLMFGDCLQRMKEIESSSVDLILADPPYGTTACKWDSVIDLALMWEQLKRIIKPNGAIVMTASQPFTTTLISSNLKMFKYCWVWEKTIAANFGVLKWQPAKKHEDVVVFAKGALKYIPQMTEGKAYTDTARSRGNQLMEKTLDTKTPIVNLGTRHPSSIIKFPNGNNNNVHPTQKPVALMEYLINTYTNEGETVLDFTMGSGTTLVAAINTSRKAIGIEMDKGYFDIAAKRIAEAQTNKETQ